MHFHYQKNDYRDCGSLKTPAETLYHLESLLLAIHYLAPYTLPYLASLLYRPMILLFGSLPTFLFSPL